MVIRDLKFAFRQLTKSPGFAIAVVLTLALGIGVNTAVFSMVDGFLLRSLPFREPERVAALIFHAQGVSAARGEFFADDDDSHDGETWQAAKDGLHSASLAAWGATGGVNLQAATADGSAIRYVHDTHVSADYFDVLGVPLARGRTFTAEEDRPHGPNAVVLSYGLWQSAFRGDPSIVGRADRPEGRALHRGRGACAGSGDARQRRSVYAAAAGDDWRMRGDELRHPHATQAGSDLAASGSRVEPPAIAENRPKPEECAQARRGSMPSLWPAIPAAICSRRSRC